MYNQAETGGRLTNLKMKIDKDISNKDLFEVHRVTEVVVKQGLKLMKANKSDAIFDFQSDCLTRLLQLFISHGYVPELLLVCTLLPLVKDNLGDLSASDNYRAIATSCQVLKLLDIVILILEGEKLGCDQLQFGFQAMASTNMCSWLATSVIDHYNRQGSVVYSCAMDLSKAFDMVEWLELFEVLQDRKISPIFLRIHFFL